VTRTRWWPDHCSVCHAELPQPSRGRPRRCCDNPECRRKAAAERQARRRRRLQGLPERTQRQPGGGRRSLLERAARSWAAEYLPDLDLTVEELRMLEEFLRDAPYASPYDFRGNRRPTGCPLSREMWLALRDLVRRQADGPRRRRAEETARREKEWRRVALAEHPGGEYLGGGLVRMPDGSVPRSSAAASNDERRSAIGVANDADVNALLARGRSLASLVGDGARAALQADERQRENLAALERMAAELRREEQVRRTGTCQRE
jgi:hypothetical protein